MRHIIVLGLIFISLSVHAANSDFSLSSNGLINNGPMPTVYTCDGLDISPQLQWSQVPANTQSFVLIVSDSDAPAGIFYHWVVYNIPGTTRSFDQGVQQYPQGTMLGKNSANKTLYYGACPPKGASHHYEFTLYALDKELSLPPGSDAKTLLNAIKDHVIKKATLTSIYSRWF